MTFEDIFFIDIDLPLIVMIIWAASMLVQFVLSLIFNNPKQKFSRKDLIRLAVLSALMVLTSIFLGFDVSSGKFEIYPLATSLVSSPVMLLGALPWMFAAIFLNPVLAFSLAVASGFLNAVLFTHSILTPLYYGFAALTFHKLIKLDLSIRPGRFINSYMVKVILTIAIQIPIALLLNLILFDGYPFDRLVAERILLGTQQTYFYAGILLSGIVIQIISLVFRKKWQKLPKNSSKISRLGRLFLYLWTVLSSICVVNLLGWQYFSDSLPKDKFLVLFAIINFGLFVIFSLIWKFIIQARLVEQSLLLKTNHMISINFNEVYQGDSLNKKPSQLEKSINELRKKIKVERDVQERLIALDPALPEASGIGNVLSSILRSAYDQTVSSVRIILFNKDALNQEASNSIRMGLGTHNKLFAYMDDLIAARLQVDKALYLSDLKVNQVLELKQGMPFPPALIGLRLEEECDYIGNLWIGFVDNRWYDDADRIFYSSIATRAVNMISSAMQISLAKSQYEQLSAILEEIPYPVVLLTSHGEIRYTNKAGKAIEQSLLEKFIKSKMDDYFMVDTGLDTATNNRHNMTFSTPDRKFATVYFEKSNLTDSSENYLLVLRDESFVKGEMDNRDFVTTVSHALRMPLTRIKGYTSLLENIGSLSDQQSIYLQRIFAEMDTMQKLIDNILNMERLEANVPLQFSGIEVKGLIEYVTESVALQAIKKKISVNLNMNDVELKRIYADEALVQQALINLLDNAIRYSTLGGVVEIQVKTIERRIQFIISDNGPGIAPLDVPRLFDKYFHVESGQATTGKGVGLGLAIVRSVAQKHGGEVKVTSKLGQGSTFYFEIPINSPHEL